MTQIKQEPWKDTLDRADAAFDGVFKRPIYTDDHAKDPTPKRATVLSELLKVELNKYESELQSIELQIEDLTLQRADALLAIRKAKAGLMAGEDHETGAEMYHDQIAKMKAKRVEDPPEVGEDWFEQASFKHRKDIMDARVNQMNRLAADLADRAPDEEDADDNGDGDRSGERQRGVGSGELGDGSAGERGDGAGAVKDGERADVPPVAGQVQAELDSYRKSGGDA